MHSSPILESNSVCILTYTLQYSESIVNYIYILSVWILYWYLMCIFHCLRNPKLGFSGFPGLTESGTIGVFFALQKSCNGEHLLKSTEIFLCPVYYISPTVRLVELIQGCMVYIPAVDMGRYKFDPSISTHYSYSWKSQWVYAPCIICNLIGT